MRKVSGRNESATHVLCIGSEVLTAVIMKAMPPPFTLILCLASSSIVKMKETCSSLVLCVRIKHTLRLRHLGSYFMGRGGQQDASLSMIRLLFEA
jgi:hypothetical protein